MRNFITILIILAVSLPGYSQQSDDVTILLGRHYSFVLKEPSGWTMDIKTAKSQGLEAVFYRNGSSWRDAVAVMYARVIYKDETQNTVEKVVSNDIEEFMKLSKESKVSDFSPPLKTRFGKEAVTKAFYDAANKNHELVVFIDEPKVVVILVLSSRDKDEYEKALPAFKALVGTYFFTPLVQPQ